MNARTSLLALFLLMLLGFALLGCNGFFTSTGSGPTGLIPHFAYVADGGAGTLSEFTVNSKTGGVTPVAGSPLAVGTLVAANTGAVPPTSGSPLDSDASGVFVYVALDAVGSNLKGFKINRTDGSLAAVPGSPYTVGTGSLVGVTLDASDRFVYAVDSAGKIYSFTVNGTTGQLTAVGTSLAIGGTPNQVLIDPSGRFVYAPFGGGIGVFSINGDGSLKAQTGSTLAGCSAFVNIFIEPTVHFAYVTDGAANVCGFSISTTTGILTALSPTTTTAGTTPMGVATDATGTFLYVANAGSNNVSAYLITSSGALTAVTGSPFAAGTAPVAVAADPSGLFLYVANNGSNSLSIFGINSGGVLSNAGSAPVGSGPVWLAVTR